MNLIKSQQDHIDRLLAATPYSDRNDMGRITGTPLNRKLRTVRASRLKYRRELESLGFDGEQIRITMQDAEDMAELEYYAD